MPMLFFGLLVAFSTGIVVGYAMLTGEDEPIHPQSFWRLPGIGVVKVTARRAVRDSWGTVIGYQIVWLHVAGAASDALESEFRRGATLSSQKEWDAARLRYDIEHSS